MNRSKTINVNFSKMSATKSSHFRIYTPLKVFTITHVSKFMCVCMFCDKINLTF